MTCSVEIGHTKYQCSLIWPRRMLWLWQMWLVTNMHIGPTGWSSGCWSPARSSRLEQQRYEALSDTANTTIVPWFHIVIGQDLSANENMMEPPMIYLCMLQYINAWMNGCNDELFQFKWKKPQLQTNAVPLPGSMFLEIDCKSTTRCAHAMAMSASHVD